jgi:predicted RNA-binding Zn-ribbon protein involved in translation (DUF1610 family)
MSLDDYENFSLSLPKKVSLLQFVTLRVKDRGYKVKKETTCTDCGSELTFQETRSVCPNCGTFTENLLVSSFTRKTTPYQPLTHFKDWLLKAQAKTQLVIPEGITFTDTSITGIRSTLRKLGLFKYYEDIPSIRFKLTGIVDFLLTSKEESDLIRFFLQITKVYPQFKSKKRKSLLSYSFIIREGIKLLFTEARRSELCLDFFTLPKFEKVQEYHLVFGRIKAYYGW